MKTRRAVRLKISICLCLLILSTSWYGCANRAPIRIGFAGELSGRRADLGVHGRDGTQLAVETINANGGVAGRPLELVVRDDLGTPEGAQLTVRELIEAGVVAIIGHMTSKQSLVGREITEEEGVILFSPTTSTPSLSGLDDHFFRLNPTNLDQARALAKYIIEQLDLYCLAIIYDIDNADYSESYAEAFASEITRAGGEVLIRVDFSASNSPDFYSLIEQLLVDRPEGVLIIASALDTALIAQHIRQKEPGIHLFTSGWAQTEALIQGGGRSVEGMEMVMTFDVNNSSLEYQKFSTQYLERFGRSPSFAAAQAYEVVLVLAAALEQTGGQAEGLRQALLKTQDFEVPAGRISLDVFGDVVRGLYLSRVQGGHFVTVAVLEPED